VRGVEPDWRREGAINVETLDLQRGFAANGTLRSSLAACLMTDAERYTGLIETMEPAAIVDLVNRYFDALFGPVLANGGVVSDLKGDGMLAVWTHESAGASFKARVCKACLELLEGVDRLNRRQPAHRLPTRLGVDFGPVALARVGAHARYEYRPVGDPVNTASRLQELNKVLGTRVLVSDSFAQSVEGYLFRDLGSFQLRGKRARTRVRELIGAHDACSPSAHQRCRDFAHAVAAYEMNDERDAQRRFRDLQQRFPTDGPTRFYLQRIAESLQHAGAQDAEKRGSAAGWFDKLILARSR
jgi:adenylate cyclase